MNCYSSLNFFRHSSKNVVCRSLKPSVSETINAAPCWFSTAIEKSTAFAISAGAGGGAFNNALTTRGAIRVAWGQSPLFRLVCISSQTARSALRNSFTLSRVALFARCVSNRKAIRASASAAILIVPWLASTGGNQAGTSAGVAAEVVFAAGVIGGCIAHAGRVVA